MQLEVFADAAVVAEHAARFIAAQARTAVRERGRFTLALSGTRSQPLLSALARHALPWSRMQLLQVDERVAPAGDAARNLTAIESELLPHVPLAPGQVHAMPVEAADLAAAAHAYAALLQWVCGTPAVLDLAHLGLGEDGHTASLVPGDAVLQVSDCDVALSGPYQGHRRMTLTYPLLNRARCVLWLATGADKRAMVARLRAGDTSIPAGRIEQARAIVLVDPSAMSGS